MLQDQREFFWHQTRNEKLWMTSFSIILTLGSSRTQFNSSVSQNTVSMTHHRLRLMLSCQKRNSEANKSDSRVNKVLSMTDNSTWKLFVLWSFSRCKLQSKNPELKCDANGKKLVYLLNFFFLGKSKVFNFPFVIFVCFFEGRGVCEFRVQNWISSRK